MTPDNTVVFNKRTKALYIGTAGNIRVKMANGSLVTFFAVGDNIILPISVTKVMASITTASNIVRLN